MSEKNRKCKACNGVGGGETSMGGPQWICDVCKGTGRGAMTPRDTRDELERAKLIARTGSMSARRVHDVKRFMEIEKSIDAALALLRAPETQERGWQDIATAPKDGTPILGFMPSYYQGKGGQSVIMWMDGQWFDNRAFATEPARWQPLPSPPAQTEDR